MLSLICNITIYSKNSSKKIIFYNVAAVNVSTSTRNLTDTAIVTVPKKITDSDGNTLQSYIAKGDKIEIEAGYAEMGKIETIFSGYIIKIVESIPLAIHCENEMYLLKQINVKPEQIEKFDFERWFKKYINDIEIVTTGKLEFGSLDINSEMTMAQALDKIMQVYTFLKCYFLDGKLIVTMLSLPFADKQPICLSPSNNIVSDTLEYVAAEDVKISIKATSILADNTKLEVIVPDEAKTAKKEQSNFEQRHFYVPECKTEVELKEYAENKLKEFKVDKVTGKIILFGVPFVRKTDNIRIFDSDRKNINKKRFFIEGVAYGFSNNGYRQELITGYELK